MKTYRYIFLGLLVPALAFAEENGDINNSKKEEIYPNEDLMREHGILNRVMLIYEEIIKRIDANASMQINRCRPFS